jgi:hypothetical protein
VHGQTPVVLGSGEVERVRRGTVKVPGGFIGADAAMAPAGLWRDAGHAGRASGVLWRAQSASNTWPLFSALVLAPAEQPNVRISPYACVRFLPCT